MEKAQTSGRSRATEIIQRLRTHYPLTWLLSFARLARSTFFSQLQVKPDKDKVLKAAIKDIKAKHPDYGYRRVHACLPGVNHKKVQRLMQVLGLQVRSRKSKKFTTYRGTIGVIAPNHLERDFSATAPKQKWVTDITEFKAKDGSKVYLSPILDLFNNEIVSYNLSYSPNWVQVEDMLMQAVKGLNKACGVILHSDQGWQYQMVAYRRILAEHGIIQSMSRKGNCLDNAAMESFFGRLKTECFYGREFNSREEIVDAVRDYLDYYNHRRIQLKLKGLSPIQYRKQSFK
ncbi:IS3 family transposase [Haemophilus parainfluenzae]|uniref:IS3 family transposase n=20 Tax=Haemophilus TaxID=724 RepID=A0A369Z148_HAEPA|nr:IS3 family transposase [Haemophilus parainfluenzae]RDE93787.1 IS3 family transposase [Haemophilus parainfluenzae]RDF06746.1 IS3 family transposase [Haemophilus parainfluenzae]